VKITVVHPVCGREVLVQQILQSQGHCPWDGKPFSGQYNAVLAEALGAMEIAGTALESALDRVAGLAPDFALEEDSLVGPIQAQVDRLNAARKAPA
jgi:hypothetical protein